MTDQNDHQRPEDRRDPTGNTVPPETGEQTRNEPPESATKPGAFDQPSSDSPPADSPDPPLTIVGVGASAGGLEAFSALLHHLPADTGLAVVFVQHLAAKHESALPHLLGDATAMPVRQTENGQSPEPNTVYVIPPGVQLEIEAGRFKVSPRAEDQPIFLVIDRFFESLARDAQERAVGVILSGTASDGAKGIREIKAQGGITLVQDPEEAKYDGMPHAALATGAVDRQLPVGEMAGQLAELTRHPFLRCRKPRRSGEELQISKRQLEEIFGRLRKASGVDFSHYKPGTIKRRLQRRMLLNRLADVPSYLKYLDENPAEATALYRDVLIHVTHFFRDPGSFDTLKNNILPRILGQRHDSIRIWIPG